MTSGAAEVDASATPASERSVESVGAPTPTHPVRVAGPRHARGTQRPPSGPVVAMAVVVVASFGFGLWARLWMLAHAGLNSDEAIVGLMANAIVHGHFSAFYWGQPYGGAEPYVTAALFGAFGHSAYVLNFTATALALVAAILTGYLGWTVFRRRGVALVAGCLAWIWPEAVLWNSTREFGFRGVTLICGLLVLIFAARIVLRGSTIARWSILGVATGLGWWSSPEIVYFALPAAGLLAWAAARRRVHVSLVQIGAGIGAAVVAALPWIVDDTQTNFASLRSQVVAPSTYGERLHLFFVEVIPLTFGLRVEGQGAWLLSSHLGLALCVALGAAIVTGVVALLIAGPVASRPLVAALALFPFLYAAFPATVFWNDDRYAVFLPPLIVVVVVGGCTPLLAGAGKVLGGRPAEVLVPALGAVALLVLAAASTVGAFEDTFSGVSDHPQSLSPTGNRILDTIATGLESRHLTTVVGSYWTAYDLDLVSGGAIAATPLTTVRVPGVYRQVMRSPQATWLFVGPTQANQVQAASQFGVPLANPVTMTLGQFTARLSQLGLPYSTARIGPMVAVTPEHVGPRKVVAQLSGPA